MDYELFKQKIAEITEDEADKLALETSLEDIEGWDSLAIVTFVAMADAEFGVAIKTSDLRIAETLGDIYELVCDSQDKKS